MYKERPEMRHSARIAARANKLIRIEKVKIDAMSPPWTGQVPVPRVLLTVVVRDAPQRVPNEPKSRVQPNIVTHDAQPRVSFALEPTVVMHDAQPRVLITRARLPTQQQATPIASRTRAIQAKVEAHKEPILRRTRSQYALETALAAAA